LRKNAVALTVAGSDSGGGAGIQADIKTFSACGVYGASAITAVTAQNLEGVHAIQAVKPAVVEAQMRAVLEGYPVKAAKTGMLFQRGIIEAVVAVFRDHPHVPLVVDPVFAASSGSRLIEPRAIRVLCERLFPRAALVTPNLHEAEFLCARELRSLDDLRSAGESLFQRFGVPFLMKGGHLSVPAGDAIDLLVDGRGTREYVATLVGSVNSHGSGCTFSAAITAYLARGRGLRVAVAEAKSFITASLRRPHYLRPGTRVINHFFRAGGTGKRWPERKA
jgi:hydroxymethylpyrimidine/phosphomethylpyrimidine kinase